MSFPWICVARPNANGRVPAFPENSSNLRSTVATRCNPAYIRFTLLSALYLLPFMRIVLSQTNEGSLIYGAKRIVHGQVFARDFFEVMGPGTMYIVALFLKIFGETFFATRIWLFCASLGTGLVLYVLSCKVCPRHRIVPTLVLAGTCFGMQWPSISHHVDSTFFALLAVVCVAAWEERQWRPLLGLAGVCAGITSSIHQPKGALLLIAIVAWILIRSASRRLSRMPAWDVIAGFAVVLAAMIAYFWSHHALHSLYYANVVWPSLNYSAVNACPYALGIFAEYWHHWAVIPGCTPLASVPLACILIVPFIFVALLPFLLLALGYKARRTESGQLTILLCVLCGWALWLSEVHRTDIYHLVFGSPLLIVVCVRLVDDLAGTRGRMGLQALAIASVCLISVNLLQVSMARSMPTRAGTIGVFGKDRVLEFANAHIAPGEDAFFYPYRPMYYFLTGATNPTRFSILLYNYNTLQEFEQTVGDLESREVRYIFWDTNFDKSVFPAVFPGVATIRPEQRVVEPYLNAKYTLIAEIDGYRILKRKPPPR
jgi:hypothetical protein